MKTSKSNVLSFKNQVFYIGLDVHKDKIIAQVRSRGINIKKWRLSGGIKGAEELKDRLEKNYPGGIYQSVYEAGFHGFSIARRLEELGISCMVVNPADIPTKQKEKEKKNDVVDSKKLAISLEKAELDPIYMLNEEDEALRSLCRTVHNLSKDMTRIKNRIKGLLYEFGYQVKSEKKNWSRNYIEELKRLSEETKAGETLKILTMELEMLRGHRKYALLELRRKIESDEKKNEILKLLLTIPGIGFISAATFICEIIDINRFSNFDKFACYIGLIPRTYSSGDKDINRGKSKRGNKWLSKFVIENTWVAIQKDPVLFKKYSDCVFGNKKKQIAIIKTAKKLMRRLYYVWKTKTPYEIGVM